MSIVCEKPQAPAPTPHDLEVLARRYAALVLRTALQVTRNIHDAEDVAQATFLALAHQLRSGEPIRQIGGWLTQVAHRTALDLCRSRKRRRSREHVAGRNESLPDATVSGLSDAEVAERVRCELQKLPADYRTALILHYYGGLSSSQIARQLGSPPKAMSMRLLRGRRLLAERLARQGVIVGSAAVTAGIVRSVQQDFAQNLLPAAFATPIGSQTSIHASLADGVLASAVTRILSAIGRYPRRAMFAAAVLSGTAITGGSQYLQPSAWLDLADWVGTLGDQVQRLFRGPRLPEIRLMQSTPSDGRELDPAERTPAVPTPVPTGLASGSPGFSPTPPPMPPVAQVFRTAPLSPQGLVAVPVAPPTPIAPPPPAPPGHQRDRLAALSPPVEREPYTAAIEPVLWRHAAAAEAPPPVSPTVVALLDPVELAEWQHLPDGGSAGRPTGELDIVIHASGELDGRTAFAGGFEQFGGEPLGLEGPSRGLTGSPAVFTGAGPVSVTSTSAPAGGIPEPIGLAPVILSFLLLRRRRADTIAQPLVRR